MKNEENKKLKLISKIVLIVFIAMLGVVLIYFGFAKKDTSSMIFNETGAADYKVYLKKNDYYNAEYLDKGMSYVASLIDYIHLDFDYDLSSSREANVEYKYRIDAELIITERGEESKVLYRKNTNLREETIIKKDTDGIIKDSLNIKYDEYNAMVNNYKKDYALSVSSKLVVTMYIESNATAKEFENSDYKASNELTVTIPLSEQTIEINFNSNTINNSKEILLQSSFNPTNYIYIAVGIILAIMSVIFVFQVLGYFKNKSSKETKYTKKKNQILRQYDRLIVEADKIKGEENYKSIIDVKSFEELLDAKDNTENPILFYEDTEKKISTFMVIDESCIYIYTISENS